MYESSERNCDWLMRSGAPVTYAFVCHGEALYYDLTKRWLSVRPNAIVARGGSALPQTVRELIFSLKVRNMEINMNRY